MAKISFKPRTGGATVQLVRHAYCRTVKRSRTVNVGSVSLDADPDDLADAIRVVAGQTLTDDDLSQIRAWLRVHGDPRAAERRRRDAQRIEAEVRAKLAAGELASDPNAALTHAADALAAAATTLGDISEHAKAGGTRPWDALRTPYLGVYRAWLQFVKAAQSCGVAKTAARRPAAVAAIMPKDEHD